MSGPLARIPAAIKRCSAVRHRPACFGSFQTPHSATYPQTTSAEKSASICRNCPCHQTTGAVAVTAPARSASLRLPRRPASHAAAKTIAPAATADGRRVAAGWTSPPERSVVAAIAQ